MRTYHKGFVRLTTPSRVFTSRQPDGTWPVGANLPIAYSGSQVQAEGKAMRVIKQIHPGERVVNLHKRLGQHVLEARP